MDSCTISAVSYETIVQHTNDNLLKSKLKFIQKNKINLI